MNKPFLPSDTLLDLLPVHIYVKDEAGRFLFVNRVAARFHGLDPDQIAGRTVAELFAPEVAARFDANDREAWRANHMVRRQETILSDGEERSVVSYQAIVPCAGRRILVGAAVDVTDALRAEQVHRTSLASIGVVLRHVPALLVASDAGGRITMAEGAALATLGCSRESLLGTPVVELFGMARPDTDPKVALEALRRGEALTTDCEIAGHSFACRSEPMRDGDGEVTGIVAMAVDISEHKRAERDLRLWATVFQRCHEAILITDPAHRTVAANQAFARATGLTAEEAFGQTPEALLATGQEPSPLEAAWPVIEERDHWEAELEVRGGPEGSFPARVTMTVVRGEEGAPTHHIVMVTDISERRAAEARIRFLAHHDYLTGLPNRALLHDRLAHATAHARRHRCRLAVLFVDLDRFKHINDSLGHDAGDLLLKQVARRLARCVRDEDTLSRQGGDEFVVVLHELTATKDAALAAKRMLDALAEPFEVWAHELRVTPSIGISVYPHDGSEPEELIGAADSAMYEAKELGRNTFRYYTADMSVRAYERLAMESRLRRALDRDELVLYYQPQIHLGSGEVSGVEALLRWQDPEMGLVPPNKFIPLAEESRLIIPMSEWVVAEACRQHLAWLQAGLPAVPIAVNLSALQFHQPDFVGCMARIVGAAAVDPGELELELTESILIQDADETVRTLHALRDLGLGMAIDDFGTGYSCLSYLRRFPINKLKVDRSFTRQMTRDRRTLAIVQTVVALARSLELRVVAEGVEDEREARCLADLGCDYVQGFYFARPLPAAGFADWYRGRVPALAD